jgi:tetrahydromethanopterin S-methyltransferase subunit F
VPVTNQFYFTSEEETRMFAKRVLGFIIIMFVLIQAVIAGEQDGIQTYFNDAAYKVKAKTDPEEKREILNESLQTMLNALDKVQSLNLISKEDKASVDRFRVMLEENQDELNGTNGYERVSDSQLDAFSMYVVQNMEQADKTITIGLVSALLIVIIIILLV